MWIFTQTGFVSAVHHYSEPNTIVVRARDRVSLEGLAESADAPIEKSPTNDYPYRVHVPQQKFTEWLVVNVTALDYTNFKDRVYDTRGEFYSDTLLGVWEIMHHVEDDEARTGR